MAATQRSGVDSPLMLDFKDLDMSLTEGTSIPAPPESPPLSPLPIARPPTPGGGPLSSHPATPVNSSPYSPPPSHKPSTPPISATGSPVQRRHEPIHRKPLTPTSANSQTLPQRRDSTGVRKLLSLSSLRNSFSGRRSSLNLSRSPSTNGPQPSYTAEIVGGQKRRPSSPSIMSSLTTDSNVRRPSVHALSPSPNRQQQQQPPPQLRKRKSGSWFNRKSGLFSLDGENETPIAERTISHPMAVECSRPETAIYAPQTPVDRPAPALPDVSTLKGGRLTDGAFAEEDVFTSIGR